VEQLTPRLSKVILSDSAAWRAGRPRGAARGLVEGHEADDLLRLATQTRELYQILNRALPIQHRVATTIKSSI
jgi:hypothetical protein